MIFGPMFPNKDKTLEKAINELTENTSRELISYKDTEEFIEDKFLISDDQKEIKIECKVTQNGFQPQLLSKIKFLKSRYDLDFYIDSNEISKPYDLYWKVTNYGDIAKEKDCIRGQIVKDKGYERRSEHSSFNGEHIVECFVVKNSQVVASGEIDVNINLH